MVATAPSQTAILQRITAYAEDVLSDRIVAGRLVKLACERHIRDMLTGYERGLEFDEDSAAHGIAFIENLRHSKGEWAGQYLRLSDWQVFIVGSVFGWRRADGSRRFREVYTELARKNGKTTLLAGVGLYLMIGDGEPGAEVYAAATKRDQAKLCWTEARRMVSQTPALAKRVVVSESRSNLAWPALNAKFEPLGRDSDTSSGLNPNGAIVDELHEHPNRGMCDILETAVGSRRQPLIWYITTAGSNQESIWWEKRDYACRVVDGSVDDDRLFVYVATLDAGDDWRDEAVWPKANPNLGVSVKLDTLREECRKAEAIPAQQNSFRRLRLNQPTEQAERWIDMATWDTCDAEPEIAEGDRVFVGLDMSSKVDMTAAVALKMQPDGFVDVLCRFWRPEETTDEAEKRDRVPYRLWAEQGYVQLLPGTMIDPAAVAEDVLTWAGDYEVVEIPYDTWNAASAAAKLEHAGATCVGMSQGYTTYSEPCHTLEGLLASGKLRHGGNPVLRWMAGQMMVKHGPNDAVRPWKPHGSGLRNDGVVALLMALNRALVHQQQDTSTFGFWNMSEAAS